MCRNGDMYIFIYIYITEENRKEKTYRLDKRRWPALVKKRKLRFLSPGGVPNEEKYIYLCNIIS